MTEETVSHPAHYSSIPAKCACGKAIECIQVAEHMGFNLGNAMKYLWRAEYKGNVLEDLRKAAWYINREIENRDGKQYAENFKAISESQKLRLEYNEQ